MMKNLILAALLFCGVGAYGQAYQQNGTFGIQFKRLATDSGFNLPKGDTSLNNSLNRGGALVYKSSNQKLYFHNGSYWIPLTSGAASVLNFANTDLSFDAERTHTINGFDLTVQNSLAAKGGYFKLFSGGAGIFGAKNSSNLFTGLQANATQSLALMTNDNDRLTIASNGRVRFNNYNLGDSVLTSDGSGNLVGALRMKYTDTTSLSNRINLKLNISDTAAMLVNYAEKVWVDSVAESKFMFHTKDYGAIGNNIADDQPAIQAAINAAAATSGIVFIDGISGNQFKLNDSLTVPNGVSIRGKTGQVTQLMPNHSRVASISIIYPRGVYSDFYLDVAGSFSGHPSSGRGISIVSTGVPADAQSFIKFERVNGTSKEEFIYIDGTALQLSNIRFAACNFFKASGTSSYVFSATGVRYLFLTDCNFYYTTGLGNVYLGAGSYDTYIQGGEVAGTIYINSPQTYISNVYMNDVEITTDNNTIIGGRTNNITLSAAADYNLCATIVSTTWSDAGTNNSLLKPNTLVGIGTILPPAKLTITGTDEAFNPASIGVGYYGGAFLQTSTGTNDNATALTFGYNSGGSAGTIPASGIYVQSSSAYGSRMFFGTTSSFGIVSSRMMINEYGNVGIGTAAPNASAILDVTSTTKGVLFPRMTTTQKNALTAVEGLIVYDLTLHQLSYYNGSAWISL